VIVAHNENPYATPDPPRATGPTDVPELAAPQTIRYVNTVETFTAYNVYRTMSNKREQRARWRTLMVLLPLLAMMGLLPLALRWQEGWPDTGSAIFLLVIPALTMAFIGRLLYVATTRKGVEGRIRRQVEAMLGDGPNPYVLGERQMTIDADGLLLEWPLERCWTSWQAVEQVVIEEHYLFLVLSSLSALVVPRTAFVSQSDFLGFAHLARKLRQEHLTRVTAEDSPA
jgi:hypothetical protein